MKKGIWYLQMMVSIAGWIFLLAGTNICFSSSFLNGLWWVVLIAWGIGHPLELYLSIPVGKAAGLSPERTIIKTMLFGYTWWLPLKLGIIEK